MLEQSMAEQPERDEQESRLVAALRGTFDVSVMNFGAYNILYAANRQARQEQATAEQASQPSVRDEVTQAHDLLLGYRWSPMEMVLCPVDLSEVLSRADAACDAPARLSVPLPVNMTNLAGMAAEDRQVEITMSTGHRVVLDVQPRVTFSGLPSVELDQSADVQDFFDFVDQFMDTLEGMNEY